MKVICTKTSIEFTASGFATLEVARGAHPLFSVPFSTLLSLTSSWKRRELSEGESRVLFVALFDSTGRVRWDKEVPATPPPEVVEKYMDYMLLTANWKNAIGDRLDLPDIHITQDTRYMKDVGTWLNVWNAKQNENTSASYTLRVREDIAKAQDKLKKLLVAGREDDSLFMKHLFNWFLVATNVPHYTVADWEKLFFMSKFDLWEYNGGAAAEKEAILKDFDELRDWTQEKLFSNGSLASQPINSYGMLCYRHIMKQIKEVEEGVLGALGEGMPNYVILSPSPATSSTTQNEVMGAGTTELTDEPKPSQFSSSVEFLRARAKWKLSQLRREEAQERREQSEHGSPASHLPSTEDNSNEVGV